MFFYKNISLQRLEKVQKELYEIQNKKNKYFENKSINVLVEKQTKDKMNFFGRSEYMTSVIYNGKQDDIGKIVPVKIKKSNRSSLFGEIFINSSQKVA